MKDTCEIYEAMVAAQGWVALPVDVIKALGVNAGDRISFVCRGNEISVINPDSESELERRHNAMISDDEIIALVKYGRAADSQEFIA